MTFRFPTACLVALASALLPGCAWLESMAPGPATASAGPSIYSTKPWFVEEGIASWYGGRWIGRLTANGERYRAGDMTAAHKKLPFNTRVRVTDLKTGKQVVVRINNRGPFIRGRIIDLTTAAAKQLGTYDRGIAKVRIEALKEIPKAGPPNLSTARLKKEEPAGTASSAAPSRLTPMKKL
jgi:rare lipoprotein A